MEVLEFRNSYDSQGPSVPGISPMEAVTRLQTFQALYFECDVKRKTMELVSKLLGLSYRPFLELDRTAEVGNI